MDIVDACNVVETSDAPSHFPSSQSSGQSSSQPNSQPGSQWSHLQQGERSMLRSSKAVLTLSRVTATGTNGEQLFAPIDLTIKPGDWVHVTGPSSAGKSTLTRIIGGLARPASGDVDWAPSIRLAILPQKAYLPLGTLREILCYPRPSRGIEYSSCVSVLARVELAHLAPRLDDNVRWDRVLSNGERQRVGVARVLLQRPDLAIIDDAISALDDPSRDRLVQALREDCYDTAFVTFGQKSLTNSAILGQICREISMVETLPQTNSSELRKSTEHRDYTPTA
jgi:ABC-type uncharacterized transport system fused permease/ATPase subunit